ncbi:MAG: ABC transporter substrate-binding protein [Candidatus Bathyarchaeia archaeon]
MNSHAITKIQAIVIAIVVIVAALGAVYYFIMSPAPSPTAPAPEVIKIGWVAPLTGAGAPHAKPVPWVAQKMEEAINAKGGIYLKDYGKRIPVKIILKDCQSDASISASVAADLITKEGVHLLIATFTPAFVLPAVTQAEKYEVPCLSSMCPIISWSEGGPYKWTFDVHFVESYMIESQVRLINSIIGKTNGVIGTLYRNDVDGIKFYNIFRERIDANKVPYKKIVHTGFHDIGTKDFGSLIQIFKAEKVEIVIGNSATTELNAFWVQCQELGFRPKYFITSRGFNTYTQIKTLGGDLPLGIMCEWHWSRELPFKSSITGQTASEWADLYEKENNEFYQASIGYLHILFEIAVDAFTRAGSVDKEKVRDAIANTDLNTIFGHIKFKEPIPPDLQPLFANYSNVVAMKEHWHSTPVFIGQWVKGAKWDWENVIVYNIFKDVSVRVREPIPAGG